MLYVYGALAVGGALMLVVSLVKIRDCFVPPARDEAGTKAVL
jgi:TRAP-type C4-dicarboxylate transport system permease small subunit